MRVVDPLRKPDITATPRAGLPPFLPTLGLALAAALLSLACREPAKAPADAGKPVSAQAVPAMASAPILSPFNPGNALVAASATVPATEAFARLLPLVAANEAAPAPARPARARAERRRPAVNRLATTQPAAPQRSAARPATPPEAPAVTAEAEGDRFLPAGALPFAAIDAAWDAARNAGTGAAHLGSSVVSLVSDLR